MQGLPDIDYDNEINKLIQQEKIIIDEIIDNLDFLRVFNRPKYPYTYDESLESLNFYHASEWQNDGGFNCENLENLRQIFSDGKAKS